MFRHRDRMLKIVVWVLVIAMVLTFIVGLIGSSFS